MLTAALKVTASLSALGSVVKTLAESAEAPPEKEAPAAEAAPAAGTDTAPAADGTATAKPTPAPAAADAPTASIWRSLPGYFHKGGKGKAKGASGAEQVPYGDSKLTRILQVSGGLGDGSGLRWEESRKQSRTRTQESDCMHETARRHRKGECKGSRVRRRVSKL